VKVKKKKKKRLHSNQSMMSAAQQVPALGRFLHHMTVQQQTCRQMAPQMMTNKQWQLTAQRKRQDQMTGWNHSQCSMVSCQIYIDLCL